MAYRSDRPLYWLINIDGGLAQPRTQLRLAHDWKLISVGHFEHGARLIKEIKRLQCARINTRKKIASTRFA